MHRSKIIEGTVKIAKKSFKMSLRRFYPAYGRNGFKENNLTFQFAHAFCKRPYSHAFMEVPFYNSKTKKHDFSFDAYIFDNKIGIFLESKRLFNPSKAESVSKDIGRMNRKNIYYILKQFCEAGQPSRIYTLVLCETWKESVVNWWMDRESGRIQWDDDGYPSDMIYDFCEVMNWKAESLFWLYAYRRLLK